METKQEVVREQLETYLKGSKREKGAILKQVQSVTGFGSIARGLQYSKNVSVVNSGQVKIHIEALVSGDDVFRNYLELNSASWRSYKDTIEAGANKSVGVSLNVPTSYSGSGAKNGKLIIWAIQSN